MTIAGGRIRLSAECIGAQAVVRISDNSIGIPHDQLERVFDAINPFSDPLQRAMATSSPSTA